MYIVGSFILSMAILAGAIINKNNSLKKGLGGKTRIELEEENKQFKVAAIFLLFVALCFAFVQFKKL
ncbi:MAG: hypothetical protein ISS18_15185 [Bacteroidales bacterium]|nr:hypothetical protein [Bacteroidales bacterium]